MKTQVLNNYIKVLSDFPMYVEQAFNENAAKHNILLQLLEDYVRVYDRRKKFNQKEFLLILLTCEKELLEAKNQKLVYIVQGRIVHVIEISTMGSISFSEKEAFIQNNQDTIEQQINNMGNDRAMMDYRESLVEKLYSKTMEEYPMIEPTTMNIMNVKMILGKLVDKYINILIEAVQKSLNEGYMTYHLDIEQKFLEELENNIAYENEYSKVKRPKQVYRYK